MRHFFRLFLLMIWSVCLAACAGDSGEKAEDELSVYAPDGSKLTSIIVSWDENKTPAKLYSSAEWTARVTAGDDWITVSPASGDKGFFQLSIDVTANEQEEERAGIVDFYCGETKMHAVTVKQAASEGGNEEPEDQTFNRKTKVIAHRGFHTPGTITLQKVTENSLEALIRAQELGIYGAEFDVWITTDDVVVVNHNASIPTDPKAQRIDTHTYDDIKDVTLSNGEKVPTLVQYLEQGLKYPEMKLVLELKTQGNRSINNRLVDVCIQEARSRNMLSQIVWIAFDYENCLRVHRALPDAIVQYLNGDKTPAELKRDGIIGLDYSHSVMSKNMSWIAEAQELGMLVNVWTINNAADMIMYINNKVDFITTNYPDMCKRYVEQYN